MKPHTAARHATIVACAAASATVDQTVTEAGFTSKDALWVFCKRWGLREEYLAMRDRQPVLRVITSRREHEPMRPVGRRHLKHNGVTVWRREERAA